jgi:hypothetical protein
MNLVDFFDPRNKDHLRAYLNLYKEGCWPPGFLPKDIKIPNGWNFMLAEKIVRVYLEDNIPNEWNGLVKKERQNKEIEEI